MYSESDSFAKLRRLNLLTATRPKCFSDGTLDSNGRSSKATFFGVCVRDCVRLCVCDSNTNVRTLFLLSTWCGGVNSSSYWTRLDASVSSVSPASQSRWDWILISFCSLIGGWWIEFRDRYAMRTISETAHGDRGDMMPDVSMRKQPRENINRIDVGPRTVITDRENKYLEKIKLACEPTRCVNSAWYLEMTTRSRLNRTRLSDRTRRRVVSLKRSSNCGIKRANLSLRQLSRQDGTSRLPCVKAEVLGRLE